MPPADVACVGFGAHVWQGCGRSGRVGWCRPALSQVLFGTVANVVKPGAPLVERSVAAKRKMLKKQRAAAAFVDEEAEVCVTAGRNLGSIDVYSHARAVCCR